MGVGGNIYFTICGCNVAKSVYLILEYAATKSQIWYGVSGTDNLIFNLGISLSCIAVKEAHVFHHGVRKCEPERVTVASNQSYTLENSWKGQI